MLKNYTDTINHTALKIYQEIGAKSNRCQTPFRFTLPHIVRYRGFLDKVRHLLEKKAGHLKKSYPGTSQRSFDFFLSRKTNRMDNPHLLKKEDFRKKTATAQAAAAALNILHVTI